MRPILLLAVTAALVSCDRKPDSTPEAKKPAAAAQPSAPASPAPAAPSGPQAAPAGMKWIPGGTFLMGSDDKPHEGPVHPVKVNGFWMDETEGTNAQFAAFVKATGYVTSAEKVPKLEDFPAEDRALIPPDMLKPGANHFKGTDAPVPLDNPLVWWEYTFGSSWRHPDGPGSSIAVKDNQPLVYGS